MLDINKLITLVQKNVTKLYHYIVYSQVLAVGVDNIFILVESYQNSIRQENESPTTHLGRAVGEVIPSMFMSTAAQVINIVVISK